MSNRCPLLAQIHIGKAALGLDNDSYRSLLILATATLNESTGELIKEGKTSSADMSSAERKKVIAALKEAGWKPKQGTYRHGKPSAKKVHYKKATSRKIIALWNDLFAAKKVRSKSNQAMHTWLENNSRGYAFLEDKNGKKQKTIVSPGKQHPDFLTDAEADHIIKSLKRWLAR